MQNFSKTEELLVKHVERLEEEEVLKLAEQLLEGGTDPLELLECINEGMNRVGKRYETKEYYIADLIMAGLIFKQVLGLEKMTAHFRGGKRVKHGKVLLGTVKGDIHDIGKDIFRGMLEANGFEVIDLGVDVPAQIFLKKYEEYQPDIIGLSGILTNTMEAMKETVEAFTAAGLRAKVGIIVGGNHLSDDGLRYIGADAFATDALNGVRFCSKWMNPAKDGE